MDKKIESKYFDFENPGAFAGVSGFIKNNPKLNKKSVNNVLSKSQTYTYHKKALRKFKRNQFVVDEIDDVWQVDLLDCRNLKNKKYKQWYGYIYICIDVFSRFAWAEPIETKSSTDCKKAIIKILSNTSRKPKIIYSDKGKEFMGDYKSYLDKNNINQIFTNSKYKASIAERFIRTLKEKLFRVFTYLNEEKYIHILQKIMQNYNNSYHRSIGMAPNDVNKTNERQVYLFQYSDIESLDNYIEFKYKIGDYVRIQIEKSLFEKGYTQKWSTEIFVIDTQIATNPPKYTIKPITDEKIELKNNYYTEELQLVQTSEFPYDSYEITETTPKQIKIKKLNDEEQKEVWVPKKEYNLRFRR